MKFTPKQLLYFNVVLLFLFSFLLASRLIEAVKIGEYDYFRLGLNAAMIVLSIMNIIKYNKSSDN